MLGLPAPRGVPGGGGGPEGAAVQVHARSRPPSRAAGGGPDRGFPGAVPLAIGDRGDDVVLKHQMRLASLRVRGRAAVAYRIFLRALGLNIHRVAAYRAAL